MKKLILLLACIALMASLSASVFASNTYEITELNITVDAPEGWITITQNPADNAAAESFLQVDSTTIIDYIEQRAIYIDFIKSDVSAEMYINMYENEASKELISLNVYSAKQLKKFAEGVMSVSIEDIKKYADDQSNNVVDADDIEWLSYEVYEHKQATFIKFYLNKEMEGVKMPSIQYTTIQNGQTISITMSSYTGEISSSLESITEEMVDSVEFTKLQEGNAPIDLYNIVKNIMLGICIVSIVLLAPFLIKLNKKKSQSTSPVNHSLGSHDGSLD